MSIIEPRTAVITLYQGDHLDELQSLEARYDEARETEKTSVRMLGDVAESVALSAEHAALLEEAKKTAVEIKLVALPRKAWRSLVDLHPPREDNASDIRSGVNIETFKDALVPVSILEPTLSEDDLDALSDAQFDALFWAAFGLNRSPSLDPKVLRPSPSNRGSDGI